MQFSWARQKQFIMTVVLLLLSVNILLCQSPLAHKEGVQRCVSRQLGNINIGNAAVIVGLGNKYII